MSKVKVLHIINNLGVGGAERVLLNILTELSHRDDIEIYLISLEGHGELESEFLKLPINYRKFNYHLFRRFFHRFETYFRFRLWLYVKNLDIDVIHGHLSVGEDFSKVLGGLLGKPVVTTSHDCITFPGRKQKFLNRYLTKAVAVSKVVAKHLSTYYALPADKIEVIPNAICIESYENASRVFDRKSPVFMYIGRLIDMKGVQYAIEGLSQLVGTYPKMKFNVYGEGWYRPALEKMVGTKGYNFVDFKGYVKDVPTALSEGDIFVMPSESEGFSMAVLEAIAASKPIIATATGAIPEMVNEGKNGYFVEYGDAEAIAAAGKRIVEGDFAAFQQSSYNIAKSQFNIEKVADMYYNLYLSVSKRNV